jgi:phosphatidylinositol alpha-mannosyltransferase
VKIGLVTPYIYPLPGGVNAHVQHLYENLRLRGHDVRIISTRHGPQKSSEGDVIRLGWGFSVPTNGSVGTVTIDHRLREGTREVLAREQFDLLHFHEPFVPFLSLVLLIESRSVNVGTFHAFAGWSPSYEFGKRMLSGFARRLHGRIAVSSAAWHFISRYFPGDYKVIPNGVDVELYRNARPIERWQDGTRNILFVGRLEERKGVMHLLRAYRRLRQGNVNARLLIVGSGPQERDVRRYIATRRLRGVELVGRVSDEEKARYFATADVYVSPATGQESFGIVLLEAMAAGAPIVCSDIHGYKGVVRRDREAILIPPRDHEALADGIRSVLQDPLLQARMGKSGQERAEQFSWERITAKVDAYYTFVVRRLAAHDRLPPGFHGRVPGPTVPLPPDAIPVQAWQPEGTLGEGANRLG